MPTDDILRDFFFFKFIILVSYGTIHVLSPAMMTPRRRKSYSSSIHIYFTYNIFMYISRI